MRIKKLDLVGFKSFKDRTAISFDSGITGIVGPNGCGKSNIVDALVWVMGEMSAKHLRGSSMEDVIFSGAEGYAPMGMAEVTLTLENDGGPFPPRYASYSEIMVTRRLFRSGDSEYLINKEIARLRDIQEIFMDTGAGARGFSIIEQGAISKIITSKPDERRALIEEAAGITKFKVRKRESQRKLDSTEHNLERLKDIIGELGRQLSSLERQAQKAQRYRELRDKVKDLELWLASLNYFRFNEALRSSQAAFVESQDLETAGRSQISELESQNQTLRAELTEKESQVYRQQSEHFHRLSLVQKKEAEIRELEVKIQSSIQSGEMTDSLIEKLKVRQIALMTEKTRLECEAENIKLEAGQRQHRYAQKHSEYQKTEKLLSELDTRVTEQRRHLIALSQAESSIEARLQSVQDSLADVQSRHRVAGEILKELEGQQIKFDERYQKIQGLVEDSQESFQQVRLLSEEISAKSRALQVRITEKRSDIDDCKDQLNQASSRLYGLEKLRSSYEGFAEGVKKVLQWDQIQRPDVSARLLPVGELIEVEPKFERAIEAALGPCMQLLLGAHGATAASAFRYLKDEKFGRCSLHLGDLESGSKQALTTPSDSRILARACDVITIKDIYRSEIDQLLSEFIIVENIQYALELRAIFPHWNFVTLDGETFLNTGIATGGDTEQVDSGILARRREIKDLNLKKLEFEERLNAFHQELAQIRQDFSAVDESLRSIQQEKSKKEIELIENKGELERAANESQNVRQAIQRQSKEVRQLFDRKCEFEKNQTQLELKLSAIQSEKSEAEIFVDSLLKNLADRKVLLSELQKSVTQLEVEAATKVQESEGLKKQLDMTLHALNDLDQNLSQMDEASHRNHQALSQYQIDKEHGQVALDQEIQRSKTAEQALGELQNQFEKISQQGRVIEEKLNQALRARHERQVRLGEAQLQVEENRMRLENLLIQMTERYQVDLGEIANGYRNRQADSEEAKMQVEELKAKINRMGEVHVSAIEEYDEVQQRHAFLTKQHDDLILAKEQLGRVIDKINRICGRRFKDTFQEINDRFLKVFPVLFGGGEAELILIEDQESSDMGVDIVARPPGKKLQSVSLLSGGEKALTAVALIFSIFLVKPSPYCLLDEVDAPLDDANVTRFNELIREMAKRSQIILVTHNRHTMSVNKRLYGVTMQEKGVSRMVSVNLEQAQQMEHSALKTGAGEKGSDASL